MGPQPPLLQILQGGLFAAHFGILYLSSLDLSQIFHFRCSLTCMVLEFIHLVRSPKVYAVPDAEFGSRNNYSSSCLKELTV